MPAVLLSLAVTLAALHPEARVMGAVPPLGSVARGEDAAWAQRPLSSLEGSDRQVIGRWTNGTRRVGTETALWVSPRLIGAQLGYLAALERWPKGEVQRRWDLIRFALDGHQVVLIRTSAFPRLPFADLGERQPADDRFLAVEEGLVRAGNLWATAGTPIVVRRQRARSAEELTPTPFWQVVPELASLSPRGPQVPDLVRPQLGEFTAWDSVLKVPPHTPWSGTIELRLAAPRRLRTAVFAPRLPPTSSKAPIAFPDP